ncbi:uncharacterized protein LOC111891784 [Lactuca sativa]|uniref:Uncharacterized protein n=1 Tax=Lactuca sativa TaxID=4236 RepID=A0A9R1WXI6_LACSA|nr:uncharacterized protein LOC111891784 [Lactuca sativa]KAJ0191436.1 hypothetical protein LSAT_V11C800443010 [Lactuca sativa]
MVVALGPGKFYGSGLPRPRIYTDIKYNSYRVDPPVSVTDPLMSWAEEAHWSMGGLNFKRHRLQGRIEGNVEKLRSQIEESIKKKESISPSSSKKKPISKSFEKSAKKKQSADFDRSPSPPPAPLANKRKRRFLGLVDEDEDEGEENMSARKFPVRKLSDEFDLVANTKKSPARSSKGVESVTATISSKTRGQKTATEEPIKTFSKGKKRLRKVGEEKIVASSPSRISPRLVKRV